MSKEITFDEWLAEFEKVSTNNKPEQELYKRAVEFIVDHHNAGVILLSVGLNISETKARRLLAKMELDGIVSEICPPGSRRSVWHRRVLLKKKEKK